VTLITPRRRGLIPIAVVSIVLIALFLTAGVLTHGYVSSSVDASQRLNDARKAAAEVLKLQLDEETGVRGYATTGERVFLEPYYAARDGLTAALASLRTQIAPLGLPKAAAPLEDARVTSQLWSADVAVPTIANQRSGAARVQRYGKILMDRFRSDMAAVENEIDARDAAVSDELRGAPDRITLLVAVAAAALSLLAIAYALQQMRAADRIAEQERVAEEERLRLSTMEAAYTAEKRIADRLQTAFSQRPLPALETLRFSASYVPATEETRLGGDWYDVLSLQGNRVLFTIGDVTGHGIEAAVTMNRARQSFVSGALLDIDPGSVLGRVNAEMVTREERLVTAVTGIADAGTFEFIYAVAGHPPPVLLEPGKGPRFLECGSLPLGGFTESKYVSRRVQSVPGATLVLYTDGAVEHSHDVIAGEEMLLRAIAETTEHPDVDPATWIHQTIFKGRPVGDDVAILTIGFSADPALGVLVTADKAQAGFSGRLPAGVSKAPLGRAGHLRIASAWHERLAS
jgi:serine phosphatase RsbU (regulator of sigma subunit)